MVVINMSEKSVCECDKCDICAEISTKRMYLMLSKAQERLLHNTIDKKEIINYIISVKHDVLMLDDKNNSIRRDLFE